jgi:methylated-DNA-[protein]-cysteine S-methyltransferase
MNLFAFTSPTPFGPFSVALDESGAVVATAFGPLAALRRRLRTGDTLHAAPPAAGAALRRQLAAYAAGRRTEFDLPLAPRGTAFQQAVWTALREIPAGETRAYAEIADRVDRPKAARAVGRANATNPICLLIPCHRVIGADGSLTGFAFGEHVKRRLLAHEARFAPAATATSASAAK